MYYKLCSDYRIAIAKNISGIVILLVAIPMIIYFDKNIGEKIFLAVILLVSIAVIIIDTMDKLKPYPIILNINEKNQTLAIIYSSNSKYHKQKTLNFNEISHVKIDVRRRRSVRYSYWKMNMSIKATNNDLTYDYRNINSFEEPLKAVACLKKHVNIIYAPGSEKCFSDLIQRHEKTGSFGISFRLFSKWSQILLYMLVIFIFLVAIYSINANLMIGLSGLK